MRRSGMLIALNKPFGVLCQFRDREGRRTLAECVPEAGVYPAGRLDRDSEGLVILTDDGALQHRLSHPRHGLVKRYLVQVEGVASDARLAQLLDGIALKDGPARALACRRVAPPTDLWPRDPPIRRRLTVPDCWIEIAIGEGRNRQIRRMTAAVDLPTLRLVRIAIGGCRLDGLAPGERRFVDATKLLGSGEKDALARSRAGATAGRVRGSTTQPGRDGARADAGARSRTSAGGRRRKPAKRRSDQENRSTE